MEWTQLLQYFRPRPSFYFAVALACGVLLGLPDSWAAALRLDGVTRDYGWLTGLLLVASSALLLSHAVAWLLGSKHSPLNEWWRTRRLRTLLHDLSPHEKEVLNEYISDDSTSHVFAISDGTVRGLARKRILSRVSNIAAYDTNFPFNIQPWARTHLRKNPHLLE